MPHSSKDPYSALTPAWKGATVPFPPRCHGADLLQRCPSTLSLQAQCPVLGSQVPTLPAGSQAQGLDGVRWRRETIPDPIPCPPHHGRAPPHLQPPWLRLW